MCDDVHATVAELKDRGVQLSEQVSDEGFGLVTSIELPGDERLGLYEPKHASPLAPTL
jgi:hypothetical protein